MASVPALTSALLWRLSAAVAAATAKPLGSGLRLTGLKRGLYRGLYRDEASKLLEGGCIGYYILV